MGEDDIDAAGDQGFGQSPEERAVSLREAGGTCDKRGRVGRNSSRTNI